MLNTHPPPSFNKQVKILLVRILNIFLVKLIILPFEWVSCGRGNKLQELGLGSLNLVPRAFLFSWGGGGRPPREGKSPGNEVGVACGLGVNHRWPKRNMRVCMGKIEFET